MRESRTILTGVESWSWGKENRKVRKYFRKWTDIAAADISVRNQKLLDLFRALDVPAAFHTNMQIESSQLRNHVMHHWWSWWYLICALNMHVKWISNSEFLSKHVIKSILCFLLLFYYEWSLFWIGCANWCAIMQWLPFTRICKLNEGLFRTFEYIRGPYAPIQF